MSSIRILLVICVALAAWAAWPGRPAVIDTHRATRQLVIASTLARTDDAIVILGDSIVEASTLPRALCGHAIVNAGIGGASTMSQLDDLLAQALAGKRAAMVVVALGTNDAAIPESVARYRANYRALLGSIGALTPRIAVLAIPPPEPGLAEAGKVNGAIVDSYNTVLPELAGEAHAAFIALPEMPARHTVDGIHLNRAGYEVWDKAVLAGIGSELCEAK
ncbi:GDSL-type esterase/lipase family protein [Bradyrhizobium sp. Tv2a-2]|uniref:SGNH/GDSL hydrolase family protein n=1 Tax=Bradyrhizobium sp. Tv2a-2 TaxID=113395 RepID=UPI000467CBED|nr:GDSL-type esterase/lipase family protein [Bradyrhizobium sp. Tv2a-2]